MILRRVLSASVATRRRRVALSRASSRRRTGDFPYHSFQGAQGAFAGRDDFNRRRVRVRPTPRRYGVGKLKRKYYRLLPI